MMSGRRGAVLIGASSFGKRQAVRACRWARRSSALTSRALNFFQRGSSLSRFKVLRLLSSHVSPSSSRSISSRLRRIQATASKRSLILKHLLGRPYLHQAVTPLDINRVKEADASEIDDVLEVPAHQHVHASDRGKRDVQRVRMRAGSQHPSSQVGVSDRGALSRVAQELPANARAPVLWLREAPAACARKAPAYDHRRQIYVRAVREKPAGKTTEEVL